MACRHRRNLQQSWRSQLKRGQGPEGNCAARRITETSPLSCMLAGFLQMATRRSAAKPPIPKQEPGTCQSCRTRLSSYKDKMASLIKEKKHLQAEVRTLQSEVILLRGLLKSGAQEHTTRASVSPAPLSRVGGFEPLGQGFGASPLSCIHDGPPSTLQSSRNVDVSVHYADSLLWQIERALADSGGERWRQTEQEVHEVLAKSRGSGGGPRKSRGVYNESRAAAAPEASPRGRRASAASASVGRGMRLEHDLEASLWALRGGAASPCSSASRSKLKQSISAGGTALAREGREGVRRASVGRAGGTAERAGMGDKPQKKPEVRSTVSRTATGEEGSRTYPSAPPRVAGASVITGGVGRPVLKTAKEVMEAEAKLEAIQSSLFQELRRRLSAQKALEFLDFMQRLSHKDISYEDAWNQASMILGAPNLDLYHAFVKVMYGVEKIRV